MPSRLTIRALAPAVLLLCGAAVARAQNEAGRPAPAIKINLAKDSPVALLGADLGESRTDARGGAMVLDLHTSLMLRNTSGRRIRGVTLLVQTQEFAPGGKGSVTVPSLDVRPEETFPVRIDLRLLRPLMGGAAPMAEVALDGVLFDDLTFYGPDQLNSRRLMLAWELEARRDRRYFKSVLEAKGPEGLKQEMIASLNRLAETPALDVQMVRRGRATAASAQEREVRFAFLRMPGAPVEPVAGVAKVAGNEARSPRVQVLNRSDRAVRYFEIGWIIRDGAGAQFLAGSIPASGQSLALAPGARSEVTQDTALRFSRQSRPVAIDGMTGFVSQVEFADGSLWIPSRADLDSAELRPAMTPSPEEQRLADLYRRRGLPALVNELRKF